MTPEESTRMRGLERRVELLTYAAIAQALALAYITGILYVAILGMMVLFPILALTHKWLPPLARRCGRWFSSMFASHRS